METQIVISGTYHPIVLYSYAPKESGGIKCVLQINPATAVPVKLYRRFAIHLAKQGYLVFVLNYTGVGLREVELKKLVNFSLHQWKDDIESTYTFIQKTYPKKKHFIIGHSIGLSLLGFLDLPDLQNTQGRIISIAAQSGYYGYSHGLKEQMKWWLTYNLIIPILTSYYGYMPAKFLNLGENVPSGVARELAQWCSSKKYLRRYVGETFYEKYTGPSLFINAEDDQFGDERAYEDIQKNYFSNLDITREIIGPEEINVKQLGHFGFFAPRAKPYWTLVKDWIEKYRV